MGPSPDFQIHPFTRTIINILTGIQDAVEISSENNSLMTSSRETTVILFNWILPRPLFLFFLNNTLLDPETPASQVFLFH
jgi:hypothetical protein